MDIRIMQLRYYNYKHSNGMSQWSKQSLNLCKILEKMVLQFYGPFVIRY